MRFIPFSYFMPFLYHVLLLIPYIQYGYCSKTIVHLHVQMMFEALQKKKTQQKNISHISTNIFVLHMLKWKKKLLTNKCSLIFSLHGSEQHSDHKETPTDGRLHQVAMTTVTFTDAWLTIEYIYHTIPTTIINVLIQQCL